MLNRKYKISPTISLTGPFTKESISNGTKIPKPITIYIPHFLGPVPILLKSYSSPCFTAHWIYILIFNAVFIGIGRLVSYLVAGKRRQAVAKWRGSSFMRLASSTMGSGRHKRCKSDSWIMKGYISKVGVSTWGSSVAAILLRMS